MEAVYCPDCETLVYASVIDDPDEGRVLECWWCGCIIEFLDE